MTLIGIGYRQPLAKWIEKHPDLVQCLEITAEHFFDDRVGLRNLSKSHPISVHGLGLSLGTPGPIDQTTLDLFCDVAREAQAKWVSDHVAYTRSSQIDLGHLNPVLRTRDMLEMMVDHVREVSEKCGKPMLMENITTSLDPGGELDEPEFLNRLCEKSGCGLLLDVTNVLINSRNHHFNTREWIHSIDPKYIVQLHVVGYHCREGVYQDHHGAAIQDDLLDLVGEVVEYADVQAIILERDENLDRLDEIENDLRRLKWLVGESSNS